MEDFLSIHNLTVYEFNELLDIARNIKDRPERYRERLKGRVLAMIFQKPSLRTRMTFQVGMLQLGGQAVYLSPSDIQLGTRETPYDIGKNLERWVDGIMIRTFGHSIATELAEVTRIPVINALTDFLHPCQGMADFFTLKEKLGDFKPLTLAYIGDGNNVCHSLMLATAKAGNRMTVGCPEDHAPSPEVVSQVMEEAEKTGAELTITADPREAAAGADAVYTDTWTSMGQEDEREERIRIFTPYQVNAEIMSLAKPGALFMHCLPAHRGEEVTAEVIDSSRSVVFDQAENRLHIQKAIMLLLMEHTDKHG